MLFIFFIRFFKKFLKIILKESLVYINFILSKLQQVIANLNHAVEYNLNLAIVIVKPGQICKKRKWSHSVLPLAISDSTERAVI